MFAKVNFYIGKSRRSRGVYDIVIPYLTTRNFIIAPLVLQCPSMLKDPHFTSWSLHAEYRWTQEEAFGVRNKLLLHLVGPGCLQLGHSIEVITQQDVRLIAPFCNVAGGVRW